MGCLASKYPKMYPKDVSEDLQMEYQRRVLHLIADAKVTDAAPVIVRGINDIHEDLFGYRITYSEEKSHYNQLMLSWEGILWDRVMESEEPLLRALQYAIICNYIDFSAIENVQESYLLQALDKAGEYVLDSDNYESLCQDLKRINEKEGRLVLLADNCGEVVMDKLLLRLIHKLYPQIILTAVVRGGEVQNDATMEDALEVDLPSVARVITNGNNVAGTWLPELGEEAQIAMREADILISKGQANYETLRYENMNLYYIFLCKCHMLARMFDVPLLTPMLVHGKVEENL